MYIYIKPITNMEVKKILDGIYIISHLQHSITEQLISLREMIYKTKISILKFEFPKDSYLANNSSNFFSDNYRLQCL